AIYAESRDKFEAARSEERAARDALNAKRREMDSVQSVINRMKNATSIEDIHDRVRSMEHRIEHETVPLKEEKQLIRDIKQLKIHREQLSSSLGQQGELQPAPEEKAKIEDRFKVLKQEMDSCRKEVIRLEGISKAAWKNNNDEYEKQRALQAQFRAADDLRQEAYIHLQNLKKQLYEKNKYFRMYKEDSRKAEDCASARDREAVHDLCFNQVETMFELWKKNDEFRKDYIRCNTLSTIRRLKTLDGRSLGPDEESPLLPNAPEGRVGKSLLPTANNNDFPSLPTSGVKSIGKNVEAVVKSEPKNLKTDSKSVVNLEQKHPAVKSKTVTKAINLEIGAVTVSGREEKQENEEDNMKTKEEEELARKAEEMRRKEEASMLKEQRRLEEKAKAKEAEERKRRNAEKAQARAELRAQKEAELKEKEREKKARKKERKKEKVEAVSGGNEEEAVSRSESDKTEIIQEPEIKEKPKTVVKRPQKPSILLKPKVVPPPLRNRGKKRMQQWMWILLVVAVVVALFLVGNSGFSFKFGLPSFGL
ncbi:Proton pump-interactor, partial [Thalictrum thalictroides]